MISTTGKPLDFEIIEQYILKVTISDKGSPSRSTTVTVKINIDNINDNKPVFTPDTYKQTIPETMLIGAKVLSVKATDADKGTFGMVDYKIVSGNSDSTGDKKPDFEIGPVSGNKILSRFKSSLVTS